MPSFPTIIFADDDHCSTDHTNLLIELAPKLKLMSYDNYYVELPPTPGKNLEQANDDIIKNIELNMIPYIKALSQDICGRLDVIGSFTPAQYLELMEYFNSKLISEQGCNKLCPLISMYKTFMNILNPIILHLFQCELNKTEHNIEARDIKNILSNSFQEVSNKILEPSLGWHNLFQVCNENRINFKGIDDPDFSNFIDKLYSSLDAFNTISQSIEHLNVEKRNKIMIDAHLHAEKPVFASNGLIHMSGMQELLNQALGIDVAKKQFLFIYVYTKPLEENTLPFVKDIRDGNVHMPLGLTIINGIGKNREEITNKIVQVIEDKIASNNALSIIETPVFLNHKNPSIETKSDGCVSKGGIFANVNTVIKSQQCNKYTNDECTEAAAIALKTQKF